GGLGGRLLAHREEVAARAPVGASPLAGEVAVQPGSSAPSVSFVTSNRATARRARKRAFRPDGVSTSPPTWLPFHSRAPGRAGVARTGDASPARAKRLG